MQKLVLLIVMLLLARSGLAQRIQGTWYLVNRSGLVQLTIDADSLRSQRLFPDFTPKRERATATAYAQLMVLTDRQLLISPGVQPGTFDAQTLFDVVPGKHFLMAWNALDTVVASPAALAQLHAQDHRPLFGYYYFSGQFIDSLRRMKAPEAMSKRDFDAFLGQYVQRLQQSIETFRRYNYGYVASSYNFELIVQALFEQGYNPLQNVYTVEALFKRFYDEAGLQKALQEKMRH